MNMIDANMYETRLRPKSTTPVRPLRHPTENRERYSSSSLLQLFVDLLSRTLFFYFTFSLKQSSDYIDCHLPLWFI